MADNTNLNPGVGGDVSASNDIGGVKYQRIKLIHGAPGVNDGDIANANPLPVALRPQTTGGYSNSSINAAASNNATSMKASAGQVYGVHIYNNAAYPIYVKFYNKASAPAPGADSALLVRRIGVQAGVSRDIPWPAGLPFSTGIALVIVKGIGDTDNTSVAANDCLVETEFV